MDCVVTPLKTLMGFSVHLNVQLKFYNLPLINGRYERKSTIITTNVPLSSWGTVLHNQAAAEAILDRLVYHSHVIKIKGKSYRLASANS